MASDGRSFLGRKALFLRSFCARFRAFYSVSGLVRRAARPCVFTFQPCDSSFLFNRIRSEFQADSMGSCQSNIAFTSASGSSPPASQRASITARSCPFNLVRANRRRSAKGSSAPGFSPSLLCISAGGGSSRTRNTSWKYQTHGSCGCRPSIQLCGESDARIILPQNSGTARSSRSASSSFGNSLRRIRNASPVSRRYS